MIKLTPNEERVLRLLAENTEEDGIRCCSFKHLAENADDIKLIGRGCRALKKKGLYDETGLCGTCCMGEAELSYTDEYPRGSIK